MTNFIAWILGVYGITYIITNSYIFRKFRSWLAEQDPTLKKFIHCPLCVGFWIGLIAHFVGNSPTNSLILDGGLASISSYLIAAYTIEQTQRYELTSISAISDRS